jgi:hypothetical protein
MHGLKKIRQLGNDAPAKRLRVCMPAFTVSGECSQQHFEVLPKRLLPLGTLDGARVALQGFSLGESLPRL